MSEGTLCDLSGLASFRVSPDECSREFSGFRVLGFCVVSGRRVLKTDWRRIGVGLNGGF